MIRAGWATDYSCFSDGYYRDLETEAKNKGLGLWQCDNGAPTRRWGRQGARRPMRNAGLPPERAGAEVGLNQPQPGGAAMLSRTTTIASSARE